MPSLAPMPAVNFRVRPAARADAKALIGLMTELAVEEGYAAEFTVTETDLLNRGLGSRHEFETLVVDDPSGANPIAFAVYYAVPFTWNLEPMLVIKELYVAKGWRRRGIGGALFAQIRAVRDLAGRGTIRWSTANGRLAAEAFSRAVSGSEERHWQGWTHAPR